MSRRLPALLLASLFAWLALPADPATAQTAIITGVVRNTEDDPIEGATVTAESAQWSRMEETVTDGGGRFSLIGLQPGRWLFVVQAVGHQPVQGFANVRRAGDSGRIQFVMEVDPFNPPAPATGLLAGFTAAEMQADLDAADRLFDSGDYAGAIEAYEALLEQLPRLTSLHLQIGHAHRERQEFDEALLAYQAVPAGDPAVREAEAAIEALELVRSGVSR